MELRGNGSVATAKQSIPELHIHSLILTLFQSKSKNALETYATKNPPPPLNRLEMGLL